MTPFGTLMLGSWIDSKRTIDTLTPLAVSGRVCLIAHCDDGTIWSIWDTDDTWEAFPPIPQTKSNTQKRGLEQGMIGDPYE